MSDGDAYSVTMIQKAGNVKGKLVVGGVSYTLTNASDYTAPDPNIKISRDVILTVSADQTTGFIWKEFRVNSKIEEDQWKEFTFDQPEIVTGSGWIKDSGSHTLTISKDELWEGENFIIAWSCKKYTGEWKCGCKTETDCGYWMLQTFDLTVKECEPGQNKCEGANLLTCGADYKWVTESCAPYACYGPANAAYCSGCTSGDWKCEAQDLMQCIEGQWTLSKTCTAEEICDAAAHACTIELPPPPPRMSDNLRNITKY